MSKTLDALDNHTVDVVFDNLGFLEYGICRERSSSPSRIMQIVTSAVRNFCAWFLSRVSCEVSGRTGSRTSLASSARWSIRQKLEMNNGFYSCFLLLLALLPLATCLK